MCRDTRRGRLPPSRLDLAAAHERINVQLCQVSLRNRAPLTSAIAAFAFYVGDIRVEGPHPFSSSGSNLGPGRLRTAITPTAWSSCAAPLAPGRSVSGQRRRSAFITPSSGGWILFGKRPN
jgi:hypothetical protein